MPTEIKEMEAGPALDILVAEQVMGWTAQRVGDCTVYLEADKMTYTDADDFRPSRDIGDAWEVVAYVEGPGSERDIFNISHKAGVEPPWDRIMWVAEFRRSKAFGVGQTAPLAVCRAALLAVAAKVGC